MKFVHMADVHIGSWRDPNLRGLVVAAFSKAVDFCIEQKVNFLLISGDLFNTSLPPIDLLKIVISNLNRLKKEDISVYGVAGSHDYSPSGRSILEILEEVGLFKNVCKGFVENDNLKLRFTEHIKPNVKLTGIVGRRGLLDRKYYEQLYRDNLELEEGFKIFLFHTAITELKPRELEKMDSAPVSLLPKGFDYYAGGHVHIVKDSTLEGYKKIVFPGPIFPVTFSELEKFNSGGVYFYDNEKISYVPIKLCEILNIRVDCNRKSAIQSMELIIDAIKPDLKNTVVTIRMEGILESGKLSDIDWKEIYEILYSKGAISVLKNTSKVSSKVFDEVFVVADSVEEIEIQLMNEYSGKTEQQVIDKESEIFLMKTLLDSASLERNEGERISDFEERVINHIQNIVWDVVN